MKELQPQFDPGYRDQLTSLYGSAIIDQIAENWQWTPLSRQSDEHLPYVHVMPVDAEPIGRPVLMVPGFGGGIINQASAAAEFASQGFEVIVPGQNRKSILRDAANKRSAVYSQACNYLDVLRHATDESDIVDVVPHSYGAPIFETMVRQQPNRFKDSNVVMLAPGESVKGDTAPKLGRRWLAYLKASMDQSRVMECPDPSGVTGRASAKVLAANIPRTISEMAELARNNLDYVSVAKAVGSLTIFTYAEDKMYPDTLVYPLIEEAMATLEDEGSTATIRWAVPVSPAKAAEGTMSYGGDGATHDDHQFNPSRVISAVRQLLVPQVI